MLSSRLQDTALRYFLEVVRSGSVSEAATRLNVSPSAVSRQVAALEDLLGVPLFDRRPRGMAPSAAGELLAAHARRGALEADRVVSDIQALQGLRTGLVRICSSAGFAIEFLPRVMAQFRLQYPGIQFHLRVASPAAVTVAVLNGDADIGLTYSRSAERDITVRQLFDIGCSQRGLVFEPALVCNHFETLMHFVLHGGGLSISGEVTVRDRVLRGEMHAAQIREPGMSARAAELQTLSGRTLPAAVRMFLEFLQAQLRDNAPPATPAKRSQSPAPPRQR